MFALDSNYIYQYASFLLNIWHPMPLLKYSCCPQTCSPGTILQAAESWKVCYRLRLPPSVADHPWSARPGFNARSRAKLLPVPDRKWRDGVPHDERMCVVQPRGRIEERRRITWIWGLTMDHRWAPLEITISIATGKDYRYSLLVSHFPEFSVINVVFQWI